MAPALRIFAGIGPLSGLGPRGRDVTALAHRMLDRLAALADRLEAGWEDTAVLLADSSLSSCSG